MVYLNFSFPFQIMEMKRVKNPLHLKDVMCCHLTEIFPTINVSKNDGQILPITQSSLCLRTCNSDLHNSLVEKDRSYC